MQTYSGFDPIPVGRIVRPHTGFA